MHALVVGGTGMLSEVCMNLLKDGYTVSVVGRRKERLDHLNKMAADLTLKEDDRRSPESPLFHLISVDYHDSGQLQKEIADAVQKHGPIDLLVAWIHSTAPHALPVILGETEKTNKEFRVFHVLGSSTNLEEIKAKVNPPANCLYRQVKLGFILENHHSRWLTNEEIAAAVWQAVKQDTSLVAGVLELWDKRP